MTPDVTHEKVQDKRFANGVIQLHHDEAISQGPHPRDAPPEKEWAFIDHHQTKKGIVAYLSLLVYVR